MSGRAALGLALLLAASPAQAQDSHLIVISGLSGEPRYADRFHEWAVSLTDAALERWGLPRSNVIYLAEKVERDPERIAARSTRENVQRTLAELAERAGPADRVFIILIGHGSTLDGVARFNLPGPDMSAADFAASLEALPNRSLVFVNAASASGDFIPALSGADRTVITATKSGYERNETIFAGYFVEAFVEDGADIDKDGRVSVLEAFNYARREVARAYEGEGLLLTEHALLDDDGDGQGTGEPGADTSDGRLASGLFLGAGVELTASESTSDPRLAALYRERQELESRVAALRGRKAELGAEQYEAQLEALLVELALKTRAIRELEESSK